MLLESNQFAINPLKTQTPHNARTKSVYFQFECSFSVTFLGRVDFWDSSTVDCRFEIIIFWTLKHGKVLDIFSPDEVSLKWIFVLCVCLCSIRIIDHRDDANICIKHPTHMHCGISSAVPFYELFALWHLGTLDPIYCHLKIILAYQFKGYLIINNIMLLNIVHIYKLLIKSHSTNF